MARVEVLAATELEPFLELVGLESTGRSIRVVLAAEDSDLARRVPRWITGFARGPEDLVVLFPERVPAYPHRSLVELVRHEVAHVLIDRASGGAGVPRWFHEGLAMMAEGGWRLSDRSRLAMAMLRSREPTVEGLNRLFRGDAARISHAYAVSGAFVRDLARRGGREEFANILARRSQGVGFDTAFAESFGQTPEEALASFWTRTAIWYRWVPFLTSSTVLWLGITFLALLATARRRERDRKIRQAWEAEEELENLLARERETLELGQSRHDEPIN